MSSGLVSSDGSRATASPSNIAGLKEENENFTQIAAEFVQLKTDIILTSGAAGLAVRQATSDIPVVLALANDPVGSGLVANLSRPGGNITGLSLQTPDLAGKRIEIARELLPGLHRLAVLGDIGYPASKLEIDEVEDGGAPSWP